MSIKKNIYCLGIFFLLLISQSITAQQQKLSLNDAIRMGIKNSKQLQVSKARIEMANAALIDAKNNRLPNADVSGAYLRILQPNIDLKTQSSGGGHTPQVNQAVYGIANISYPIYAGGKIKYGIESAQYLSQAASLDAANDEEAVTQNIINAYISLYKAQITSSIIKDQLGASRQRDTSFSHLEQNGLLARNDLLKAELQSSSLELQLLQAGNDEQITSFNLDLLLGLPTGTLPVIDTAFNARSLIKTYEEYQTLAMQSRADLKAFEPRKKAGLTNIKIANAAAYPSLALTGGYIAADIPGFLTITNAVNFGIGIQYNISSLWKKNAKVLQAKASLSELTARQGQLSDEISTEVNTAYQNYLLSNKKIEVYKNAALQAEENYRITKNKYDNSLATITDLLDAQAAEHQAELNEKLAGADALSAYYKLLQSAGILKL